MNYALGNGLPQLANLLLVLLLLASEQELMIFFAEGTMTGPREGFFQVITAE